VGDCESAAAVVTLLNEGGGEVVFTVTVDGVVFGDPVVVGAEGSAEVVVPMDEDQVALIGVEAEDFGVILEQEIDLDCQDPAASMTPSCEEGGVVVTLTNEGPTPVDLTVFVDGEALVTETVGSEPVDVLVSLEEDQTAEISVQDGDEVLDTTTITFDCEDEPEITTEVLPASLTRGLDALPVTGSGLLLVVVGMLLLVAGGSVLAVRRRA
jgi:LPXTG-motif cell wall-anchored protein